MPVLLSEEDVRAVLPMPDLIAAMEDALREYSAGRITQPVRSVMPVDGQDGLLALMPAAGADPPALGAKLVTVYPGNHARGLPSHLAVVVLFDQASGALQALLDGRYITEARTAAVSAVSVQHLARKDASVLGIVGSGVQARSHLAAIAHVRTLEEVRVWSPTPAHREAFAQSCGGSGLRIRAVADAHSAVRGAGIVVLATASRTPVIDDADVDPGTHICAVGACRPDQREMPSTLVARARVYVDSRAGALRESGDVLLAIRDGVFAESAIAGELGEVVLGRAPGRQNLTDVTIFKSLGMAVEDVAAARLAVERAGSRQLGHAFQLSP